MTHDKLQDAANRLQDNVQHAQEVVGDVKQKAEAAQQVYQNAVDTGVQNINGGEDLVFQITDAVVSSGIIEKLGAEYGVSGAVVAVLVGLYWTWRKKAKGVQDEIQKQPDEEEGYKEKEGSKEEETNDAEPSGAEVKKEENSPKEEVEKLKSLEEKS